MIRSYTRENPASANPFFRGAEPAWPGAWGKKRRDVWAAWDGEAPRTARRPGEAWHLRPGLVLCY